MSIVRNPANTMRRGRVGETTYYVSGGQQIARQALNSSNYGSSARRSQSQQSRRVLWANLVNFYKVSSSWMPKAFETKKRNQSDYNKFMAVNIGSASVALTKAEAAAGACIAAGYIVSQGSLPSIEVTATASAWYTNLKLGTLTIDTDTTVAQFSEALVDNNGHCRIGQQLSFVSYQQSVDALGTPRLICRCYEVTLSDDNAALLRNYLPEFCSQTVGGNLGTNSNISVGGFAYILSEQANNGLLVSTQQLVLNNSALISQYTSEAQRKKAIASYGVDTEVVLSPVSTVAQTPESQPNYVSYISIDGVTYPAGSYVGPVSNLKSKEITVIMANDLDSAIVSARYRSGGSYGSPVSTITGSGKTWQFQGSDVWTRTGALDQLEFTTQDNSIYTIEFATSQSTGGDF